MTTDVVVHEPQAGLTLTPDQTEFTETQSSILRQLGVKDATRGDMMVFHHVCQRTGLDPFARQIYMIARWTKDGTKQTIQTGIDGFRLIARRAADRAHETLEYEDNLWCGKDREWVDAWLSLEHPAAAKCVVLRNGKRFPATVVWNEFVQTIKDGSPNAMWGRMGSNQLAKCAEAAALRKAFPQDLAGIYTDDEMGQADSVTATVEAPKSAADRMRAIVTPQAMPTPDDAEPEDEPAWDEPPLTKGQNNAMHGNFGKLGITDDDLKRQYIADVLKRDVTPGEHGMGKLAMVEADLVLERQRADLLTMQEATS